MNSSLVCADITTHLRIVLLALIAAILVVIIGINARVIAQKTWLVEPRIGSTTPEPIGAPVMRGSPV